MDSPEAVRPYEKKSPGELIHLDSNKLGKIGGIGHLSTGERRRHSHGIGWEYVHAANDVSRLACVEVLEDGKGDVETTSMEGPVAPFVGSALLVDVLLTDNAYCYISKASALRRAPPDRHRHPYHQSERTAHAPVKISGGRITDDCAGLALRSLSEALRASPFIEHLAQMTEDLASVPLSELSPATHAPVLSNELLDSGASPSAAYVVPPGTEVPDLAEGGGGRWASTMSI